MAYTWVNKGRPPALTTMQVDPLVHLNRAHAVVYSCAILSLLYHRAVSLLTSPTFLSFFLFLSLTVADLVLAFMWAVTQAFRWRPVRRRVFPERLTSVVAREEWPALDVFICTADPYKEPPMTVVNTALSVMAYDYPTEKLSVYVSDDGGSQLTLFAFMEAARFARYWLPFCREHGLVERCPDAYFSSCGAGGEHSEKIQILYQRMKQKVEIAMEKGGIDEDLVTSDDERKLFKEWIADFTRQEHPTIIQVLLESSKEVDIANHPLPNLIYVSREKKKNAQHHYKAGALNVLMGMRYGSLVEDYNTGYHLHCEGWETVFCDPQRPAFLGEVPITLNDALNQNKRWCVGTLEVAFSRYSPLTFGCRKASPPMAMCYAHYAFWGTWCIPTTVYAILPQVTLAYQIPLFPKAFDPWWCLYIYLFLAAYAQDLIDFLRAKGTVRQWWNDQRMWMVRGVTAYLFGFTQFSLQHIGIPTIGFQVTSKVMDDEQSKLYNRGLFDFGVESPFFVSLATIAIVNFTSFTMGLVKSLRQGNIEALFMQILISGFVMVNCWPIYEAMAWRRDGGRMPLKVMRSSFLLAGAIYSISHFIFKI